MKIFITGITGFLGSYLKNFWIEKGHEVRGSSTKTSDNFMISQITLERGIPEGLFEGFDILVHCAFNLNKESFDYNFQYTKKVFEAAQRDSVPVQIFISSYSASPAALSHYGKSKWELEQLFKDQIIIRPGLVLGNGGLFERIQSLVKLLPILPLVGKGENPIAVISINCLALTLDEIINLKQKRIYNLFYEKKSNLKEILQTTAKVMNKKRLIVSVPIFLLYYPLLFFQIFKIPFPITLENLKGYEKNDDYSYTSNLKEFGFCEQNLEVSIRESLSVRY